MTTFKGRFEGRTAIVTGGASGLGKAVAARIVAEGGKVALWDLNADSLTAAKAEIGATFTVAEVGGPNPETEMHAFTEGDRRLNSAYGFNFLYAEKLTPALVRDALAQWPDTPGTGWPSWAFENHDAPRPISRWVGPEHRDAFARVKLLLLMCLRGNLFLYQGEELGLTQVDIPFEALRDPEAIANWPLTLSRDGDLAPGYDHRVLLHLWHPDASRKAVLAVADRVLAVALGAPLAPAGLAVTNCSHERTDTAIDLETGAARAALTLRFFTEPSA